MRMATKSRRNTIVAQLDWKLSVREWGHKRQFVDGFVSCLSRSLRKMLLADSTIRLSIESLSDSA